MSDSENSQDGTKFRPCGDSEWLIPPAITKAIPTFKGKIVCDAEAYAHIEAGHGKQIREKGYADAVAFVADALAHVIAIYEVKNRSAETSHVPVYDLLGNISARGESLSRVMVYLKKTPEGNFYDVSTSHVSSSRRYRNKRPLWVHTPHAHYGLSRI